ncbi:site-specific integrase [Aestuariibacter salexigens]|uniref:site-specific integrase n=1 Tax=Aestuariibacter salexigens TaxID=226010 RepID=UPI000478CD8A|nr:site-specific integrase [Aestuariibacter salexigens]
MALQRQSKILTPAQEKAVLHYISEKRNAIRNRVIFLLSAKAGLRAKEIASLTWEMVVDANGEVGDCLHLTNTASKGKNGGRVIALHSLLKAALKELLARQRKQYSFSFSSSVIMTERSRSTSPQVIVNTFSRWYGELSFVGCSSHSGRRTFITNAAKKISAVGGSLRDVQYLAGHSSLHTTQRYIEADSEAKKNVIRLL